jgi:RimJ/RimL family protein N-acetyltransferase
MLKHRSTRSRWSGGRERHGSGHDRTAAATYEYRGPSVEAVARDSLIAGAAILRRMDDTLTTERLTLRPFRPDDLEAFERFGREEAYLRHLGPGFPEPPQFVQHNLEADRELEPGWVVCLGGVDGEVVGSVFLGIQRNHSRAGLAYLVDPAHSGHGIATEASGALVAYAFRHADVDRMFAWAEAEHAASRRVMEHLGMRHEATLPLHRVSRDGRRVDEVVYGLMGPAWEARDS